MICHTLLTDSTLLKMSRKTLIIFTLLGIIIGGLMSFEE